MKFFKNFPKLLITQPNGTSTLSLNLMTRTNIIPSLLNNPSLYYVYTMQEGDLPEIIANKYYDDPYRYWIFLYGNQIIDPQWDLGLSTNNFQNYLIDKYANDSGQTGYAVIAWTQSTVKYYRKLVTTVDSLTNTTIVNAYNVDYNTYLNLPQNLVSTNYFNDGSSVITTISKDTVSIYDYEQELNDKKKEVKIINKSFANNLENKLKSLMEK